MYRFAKADVKLLLRAAFEAMCSSCAAFHYDIDFAMLI